MGLMEKLQRLFSRKEIPTEARDLLTNAKTPKELLEGLDQLITRNELEVNKLTRELEALEGIESSEVGKVRSGSLPDRSKNNVLRKIQRLRKQMDNLEERQQIYNRNINLQIHLVGKIQALDAMELRGVDEDKIDDILSDYEDELSRYQSVLDSEDIATSDIGSMLDDSKDLMGLEAEILGDPADEAASPESVPSESVTQRTPAEPAPKRQEPSESNRDAAEEATSVVPGEPTPDPLMEPSREEPER